MREPWVVYSFEDRGLLQTFRSERAARRWEKKQRDGGPDVGYIKYVASVDVWGGVAPEFDPPFVDWRP